MIATVEPRRVKRQNVLQKHVVNPAVGRGYTLPEVLGAKTAVNVALFPAAIVAGTVRPVMLKPLPETIA